MILRRDHRDRETSHRLGIFPRTRTTAAGERDHGSTRQVSLHPSPDTRFPSSHASRLNVSSTMPSPHSNKQPMAQPSPPSSLPSSHCSRPSRTPLPHFDRPQLHPSSGIKLPSSQSSPRSMTPSPQIVS